MDMGKRQALAEFHRGSILAAAERLFSERGTDGTTMDDIAREAEYSKATIYVYFQSKEEIVGTILLNGLTMLKKRIHAAAEEQEDWHDTYDAVCQAILEFYRENPTAYEAVMGGGRWSASGGKNDRDIAHAVQEVCKELETFLEQGVTAGVVPERTEQDQLEAVMFFWASISGMIRMADRSEAALLEQLGRSQEEFLHDGFQMILRAVTE
jgi:AcrR family transcriptional regulator